MSMSILMESSDASSKSGAGTLAYDEIFNNVTAKIAKPGMNLSFLAGLSFLCVSFLLVFFSFDQLEADAR